MKKIILSVICLFALLGTAIAREPQRKPAPQAAYPSAARNVGIGFNSQFSNVGLNGISLRYWLSDALGIEGVLGFSFGDNVRYFDLGGKILGVLRSEQNLTLYGFGLLGMENREIKIAGTTDSDTNIFIGGGLGAEFFLQGIPNLGFGTELGLIYNGWTEDFGTFASWMPSVGVRYYF